VSVGVANIKPAVRPAGEELRMPSLAHVFRLHTDRRNIFALLPAIHLKKAIIPDGTRDARCGRAITYTSMRMRTLTPRPDRPSLHCDSSSIRKARFS